MFSSQVLACMEYACGFLVMICHWHGGLPRMTMVLPSLVTSRIDMVLWVLILFSDWFSCAFGYGLNY